MTDGTDTSDTIRRDGDRSGLQADFRGRHERSDTVPSAADATGGATADTGAETTGLDRPVASGLGPDVADRTSIVLRPLASPLPLGIFAFSIGSFVLGLAQLGVFRPEEMTTVYLMLAVFVAIPQLVAAIMAFLAREPLVATLLGLLAISWPSQYVVALSSGAPTSGPRGALFLALGLTLFLLAVPALNAKPVIAALIVVASLRYVASGLYDLTSATGWERTSGGLAFGVVLLGGYLALALVYEDLRHRTVLPVGRRGESRVAMEGGLGEQERSLPHEAGVRAQL